MKKEVIQGLELLMVSIVLATGAALVGCEEGPVEDTGEEIDDAIDDAGDQLD